MRTTTGVRTQEARRKPGFSFLRGAAWGRGACESRRHRRPHDFRLNSSRRDRKTQPSRHREPVNRARTRMSNLDQQAKRPQIRYPMAYQRPYRVAHITQAEKGKTYLCLGCGQEMIPRKGTMKRHHFAHKAGTERCDPDTALHETAKAAICQGFLTAQEGGTSYLLKFSCARCGEPIPTNAALPGASIATERAAVDGTRSDLVITKEDGKSPRIIIEIVVHHDLEMETENRYLKSGIPVIKVKPTWETVDELRNEVHGDETINITQRTCRPCREWIGNIEKKLRAATTPRDEKEIKLVPITQDRYDAHLRPDTRRRVNENARRLVMIGFGQQPKRPTLFRVKVDGWTVYADLDSTEVMKIWEVDCAPGLYAFPEHAKPPSAGNAYWRWSMRFWRKTE